MRFECNCKSDRQLRKLLDEIHKEKNGFNFEVSARLWFTSADNSKTIMVEHQVTTQECRDLTENPDEPDWLTAYLVDDEQDYDCSDEVFTETVDDYITIQGLKEAMHEFAKNVYQRYFSQNLTPKSPIDHQIQSTSARATDSHSSDKAPVKEVTPER